MGEYGEIPPDLPALWAALGQCEPYEKAWAWSDLAWHAAISDDRERAARLIREAYSQARSATQPYLQAQLLLAWTRKLRIEIIGNEYPDGIPPRVAVALSWLIDARWWIDNRGNLGEKLAEFAEASRSPNYRGITGTPRQRKRATEIRTRLVRKRWGNKIPPGVREALDRLTDADW